MVDFVAETKMHSCEFFCLVLAVINGEKAAYCTPTFAKKRERTLGQLLKGVEEKCSTEVSVSV